MHPNPIFRKTTDVRALAFVRERAFGQITAIGPDGLLAAHVPVLLSDDAQTLDLHLVRSNPIARALADPLDVLLTVIGPDGYVSPDWYGVEDQVPTWNYVAVEIRGTLEILSQESMRDVLDRQTAHFEDQLPKPQWTTAKMTPDVLEKMIRQIVPCRLTITDMQSTFKLSQNKPDDVRQRAADAMAQSRTGMEVTALTALMRAPKNDNLKEAP
jgi:transcriptional regulator